MKAFKMAQARPSVLRCGRCGKFVDWAEARLQIICACRPRLELPPVLVREPDLDERYLAIELLERDFGGDTVRTLGEAVCLLDAPLLVAEMAHGFAGAMAYRIADGAACVVAMATDPMWQRAGVGAHLLAEFEGLARKQSCNRLVVAATNDNLPALYFYQRLGFRIVGVAPAPPETGQRIPAGFGGIPIRDEIRLERSLV